MSNVQKEFNQLEHWLNSLHSTGTAHPVVVHDDTALKTKYDEILEVTARLEPLVLALSSKFETLSKQYEVQQLALNHIVDRLDMMEGARDIHIDSEDPNPWMDLDGSPLENTIIDPLDSVLVVHKEDTPSIPVEVPSVQQPQVQPQALPQASSIQPQALPSVQPFVENLPVVAAPLVTESPPPSPVMPVLPAEKAEEVEEVEEEEEEQEVEEQEETQEETQEEEEVEEQEEEEEEDGVELSEIIFNNKTYYKDSEGFIYGIDDEGQPTDQPIGVWKEKSQSIAFYRLK